MPAKKSTPVKVKAVKSATKSAPKAAEPKKPALLPKAAPAKKAAAPVKAAAPAKVAKPVAKKAAPAPVAKPAAAPKAAVAKVAAKPAVKKAAPAPAKKVAAKAPAKTAAKSGAKATVLFEKFSPESHSVEVVGSFNEWTLGKTPLKRDSSGVWSAKVTLGAGTYEYKFVFDGLSYEADPGREQVWGPFGANNLLIVV